MREAKFNTEVEVAGPTACTAPRNDLKSSPCMADCAFPMCARQRLKGPSMAVEDEGRM